MHEHRHDRHEHVHSRSQQKRSLRDLALQPSTRGATTGAVIGAISSALTGPGGLTTALKNGVFGALIGAVVGDVVTTRRRRLTPEEIVYAKDVFADSLDYSAVRIARDSMFASGAPITLGNTVYLKTEWGHFHDDTLQLTKQGRHLLIHELCHVWQYQCAGVAYFPKSLWAQFHAWLREGSRQGAYRWREALDAGLPWETWNPEQQASLIEVYNVIIRRVREGMQSADDDELLAQLQPFIERVHRLDGAPSWDSTARYV